MRIRELIYRCMSDKFLLHRMSILGEEMDKAKTSKDRKKILNEGDDILKAMLYRHRDDIEFVRAVRDGLNELLNKYKPLHENKES